MNAPVNVSHASIVQFPLSDEEAFAWLRDRDGIKISLSELGRHWGWNRSKVLRRLRRWETDGQLRRTVKPDGRSAIRVSVPKSAETPPDPSSAEEPNIVQRADEAGRRRSTARSPRDRTVTISAAVLISLAMVLAGVGLAINASFATSLGRTPEAAVLMAALGIVADGLALILPATACQLWHSRRYTTSLIAWMMWTATLCFALMAAIGFAASNITDVVAARDRIIDQDGQLRQRIQQLRTERQSIDEKRAAATIEAQIQLAQPTAQAVWKVTAGCRDVTLPSSGRACADVLQLRQALGTAQRRDALDLEIKDVQARLTKLPSVATADPQADATAKLIGWLTGRTVRFSPDDIQMARIFGMMVLPQLAGVVLMLGCVLWASRKHDAAIMPT